MSQINLKEYLNNEGVNDSVIDLILENIIVTPKTTYIYSTPYSDYSYTDEELLYSKDHLLQLVDDVLLANLDKFEHKFEKIYDFKVGDVYWLVNQDVLPEEVTITSVDCRLDSRDNTLVIEEVVKYKINNDTRQGAFFNYTTRYDQKKNFFITRQEAVAFFKDKFDLN